MRKKKKVWNRCLCAGLRESVTGVTGSRTIDYIFIPRAPGKFNIQASAFTYFNPETELSLGLNTTIDNRTGGDMEVIQGNF